MAYPIEKKNRAIELRRKGFSLNEVTHELHIPKGTLCGWFRNINLSREAKNRLMGKIKKGQIISAENKKERTRKTIDNYYREAIKQQKDVSLNRTTSLIICSLMYWCEGVKNIHSSVRFTNSDEKVVRTFLKLLRRSFNLDEKKFRVCVHLHSYHDPETQIRLWSEITKIPRKQFIKPFQKRNSGKRIREGYNGCAAVTYHDVSVARQLLMTARVFLERANSKSSGGVV